MTGDLPIPDHLSLEQPKNGRIEQSRLFGPLDRIAEALDTIGRESGALDCLTQAPKLLPAHLHRAREAARQIRQSASRASTALKIAMDEKARRGGA